MTQRSAENPIRVGVVGVGRGSSFAKGAQFVGMELVALCDTWEEKLRDVGKQLNVTTYTDYDKFLEHDMDAVMLANYFHQHAPFAIKALRAGLHVLSETMACGTVAEGVALARAVEQSGKIYLFAENYPYFAYNQEMRRLYHAGEVGEMQYGEGEYNHPFDSHGFNVLSPGMNHWRNWIPSTYYCSHALAPIMYITDTHPVSVNAVSIPRSNRDTEKLYIRRGDPGAIILCRMNNASVVRIMGLTMRGHSVWYRIHGTRGLMENLRTEDKGALRVMHEPWDVREGEQSERIYTPDFPHHAEEARAAGHSGGDFFTIYHFAEAIRKNETPYFDVYRGLEMAMVAIQGWRSCLANGAPFEIPDLRQESVRKQYEDDNWSPWPEHRGRQQPPPSIEGLNPPSEEAIAYARQVWKEMGYEED
ncbi:MAG: Gfo/Idh/MocA family oxidoreductase [Candidatus Poribacteria bacterium]|nr:Gfo/Idh/MocA family oxidoreductase [Candidatus Poribacteria bacterium]